MSVRCVVLVWCGLVLADAVPAHKLKVRHSQACGDQLADIMSLVCDGRGYNAAFKPEHNNGRRFRRGIVEECCRKSCSAAMLELYCREDPNEEQSNVPIRKRSESAESTELHQMEDVSKQTIIETETRNIESAENKVETTPTTTMKEGENYKLFNLLVPPQKQDSKTSSNKLTPNDTTEEELYRHMNYPPLRHKSHHHSSRQLHNRKTSTKTKRAKDLKDESSQTFQIGIVKPYFDRRDLPTYRSNHVAFS